MRPFYQTFAVAVVLASTGCSRPYGYSAASYGDVPAYGYPGGYSYAGAGYAYGGPSYTYAPPYAYGGVIGVGRSDWRRDDWQRYSGGGRGRDDQHWHGNQLGGDRGRASQQRFQQQQFQRQQAQQFQQQPKQQLDSGWTPRSPR